MSVESTKLMPVHLLGSTCLTNRSSGAASRSSSMNLLYDTVGGQMCSMPADESEVEVFEATYKSKKIKGRTIGLHTASLNWRKPRTESSSLELYRDKVNWAIARGLTFRKHVNKRNFVKVKSLVCPFCGRCPAVLPDQLTHSLRLSTLWSRQLFFKISGNTASTELMPIQLFIKQSRLF